MIKRTFDLLSAVIGIAVCAVPLLFLIVWIRRGSPGPAIFAQTRVGRNEQPFVCYKLRTMFSDTGDHPSHEVGASKVTPAGAILRRTKLDELPQFINVIKGELSLVGPRPCLPSQTELIEARRREGVFVCRPGITGLAQIRGIDMSVPETLAAVDKEYLQTRTFLGDLRILIATVTGAGRGVDRVAEGPHTQDTKLRP